MECPTFVAIHYWNAKTARWDVGHAGLNLMNPALYVKKLSARGIVARVVDKDTGETAYSCEGGELL